MKSTKETFYPGYFYHIYNRGNNRETIFFKSDNYIYFLQRYDYYLNDFVETFAYCLLPNHFHLLVRIRDRNKNDAIPTFRDGIDNHINKFVSQQFRRLFISYSQAINKQQNRVGSLFQKPFKRIRIHDLNYLTNVLYYIHANPQKHELIDDFRNWPYSSYGRYLEAKKSHLPKKEVLNWFGSAEEYEHYHVLIPQLKNIEKYLD